MGAGADKRAAPGAAPNLAELLFAVANALALPTWVAMAAFPAHAYTAPLVKAVAVLNSLVYVVSLARGGAVDGGSFSTLRGVSNIFRRGSDLVLNGCWTHYLVVDSLVGLMISQDALKEGIPQALVAPCLLATLMFGPAGFTAYAGVKYAYTGRF
jgi:hypothetical protein